MLRNLRESLLLRTINNIKRSDRGARKHVGVRAISS